MSTAPVPSFLTHSFTPFETNTNLKNEKVFEEAKECDISTWLNDFSTNNNASNSILSSSSTSNLPNYSSSSSMNAMNSGSYVAPPYPLFTPLNLTPAPFAPNPCSFQGNFSDLQGFPMQSFDPNQKQQAHHCPNGQVHSNQYPQIAFALPPSSNIQNQPMMVYFPQHMNGFPPCYQVQIQNAPPSPPVAITPGPQVKEEPIDDRKRRNPKLSSTIRRIRQTRPKVVESKGSIQCKGKNRKKGIQCKNAALMEYIGPKPIFCAEHIELDPCSLYGKCKSPYQREVGDKKACKEVVLKEFGVCYKHFPDMVKEFLEKDDSEKLLSLNRRICELLDQLEHEAAVAKKKDGDLYQRKNKLIPKFQEMRRTITATVDRLQTIAEHDLSSSTVQKFPFARSVTGLTSNQAHPPFLFLDNSVESSSADEIGSPLEQSPSQQSPQTSPYSGSDL